MLSKQVDLSEGLEKAIWDILYSEAMYTDLDLEDEETVETIVKVLHKVGEDLVLRGCSEEEAGV
tara:strand:+ start:333 stop:524 length:192 start_codon:yes stop_codon:yes gene_type:complete